MENLTLLIMILPLFGYILSKWLNEEPKGLMKYDVLSATVSQNPSWHLPLVIIGLLMSFLVNLVFYSIYAIMFGLSRFTNLLKWIYVNILKHIFEVIKKIIFMIAEIVVMLIKIIIYYLVTMPLDILVIVINAVPSTLNWSNYYSTFKIFAIGSVVAGILVFVGHLTNTPEIGSIGGPFVFVIALTWIVGLVSFGNHESGKRAAMFAISVIGVILGITALLFVTNQLDSITSWGGVFAGLLYAPSVLSIALVSLLLIAVAFITNVGAVYINTDGSNLNFTENLKGCVSQSFNRSWAFLLQPILAFCISAIIVAIPYILLNNSATILKDKIVASSLSSTGKSLKIEFEKNVIPGDITTNSEIKQVVFDSAIFNIGKKVELERKISENIRYSDYLSNAINSGITFGIVPVLGAKDIQNEINKSIDEKVSITNNKTEILKNINDEIKNEKESAIANSDPSPEAAAISAERLSKLKMKLDRTDKCMSAYITAIEEKINYQQGNSMRYNLTYLLFLLAGGILSAVLIALIANIYAASVMPVYKLWKSSFLVEKVNEARNKNVYQPWVGLILLGLLLFGFAGFGSKSLSGIIKVFKSSETVQVDTLGNETLNQVSEDSMAAAQNELNARAEEDAIAAAAQAQAEADAAAYQMMSDSIAAASATLEYGE